MNELEALAKVVERHLPRADAEGRVMYVVKSFTGHSTLLRPGLMEFRISLRVEVGDNGAAIVDLRRLVFPKLWSIVPDPVWFLEREFRPLTEKWSEAQWPA